MLSGILPCLGLVFIVRAAWLRRPWTGNLSRGAALRKAIDRLSRHGWRHYGRHGAPDLLVAAIAAKAINAAALEAVVGERPAVEDVGTAGAELTAEEQAQVAEIHNAITADAGQPADWLRGTDSQSTPTESWEIMMARLDASWDAMAARVDASWERVAADIDERYWAIIARLNGGDATTEPPVIRESVMSA